MSEILALGAVEPLTTAFSIPYEVFYVELVHGLPLLNTALGELEVTGGMPESRRDSNDDCIAAKMMNKRRTREKWSKMRGRSLTYLDGHKERQKRELDNDKSSEWME